MSETNLQLFPGVFRSTQGGANPDFFLHSSGRVGIGNTAPEDKPLWSSDDADRNKLNVTGHTHIDGNLNVTGHLYGDGSTLSGVAAVIGGYWDLDASNNISYSAGNVIVSGRLESTGTTGISLGGGTTAQRPTYAPLGTMRYNSTTGFMEAYTESGWGTLSPPPLIASISPVNVLIADTATEVFTVSGASFDSGLAINLVGADGTNYGVVDRTFVNATTATFKIGDLSSATAQIANRPYTVKITGGSDLATTSIQTINFPGTSWTSPVAEATLNFDTLASVSHTLAGTDALGGTSGRTFAVAPDSNPLPSPLSLNPSTGEISGTIGAVNPGTNVAFRVVDVSGAFVERTFNIVGLAPLYSFTTHTFTNAGATGRFGPTLTDLRNTYTPTWTDDTSNLNVVTPGIQKWTVPETATYTITAAGAYGENKGGDTYSGYGAIMRANITLSHGSTLNILVGQKSRTSSGAVRQWQGGGGGTFVAYSNNTPLIVAGGGGTHRGDNAVVPVRSIMNANTGTSGKDGTGADGGINGNASDADAPDRLGASSAGYYQDSKQGGSEDVRYGGPYVGAKSFLNGGVGADFIGSEGELHGGFGCGGPGGWGGSGGGGGYSGGGADNNTGDAGGGGSFASANMTNLATSDGSFTITGNEPTPAYSGTVTSIGSYNGSSNHGYVVITKI